MAVSNITHTGGADFPTHLVCVSLLTRATTAGRSEESDSGSLRATTKDRVLSNAAKPPRFVKDGVLTSADAKQEHDIFIRAKRYLSYMAHGHGLVNQSLSVDKVALSTLAARTALQINNELGAPTSSFLMKRVRYLLNIANRTINDDGPILVGCARGDATISEIDSAMTEHNPFGPEDITQSLTEDSAWVVYQNTIMAEKIRGDGTEAQIDSGWINFGGKNGIPALEAAGMQVFVFNAGSNVLTTGTTVNGLVMIQGVWLRD